MKRTILLILYAMLPLFVIAGNVTPEEALQHATRFLKAREGNGTRHAPSAMKLTMAKQVNGLYIFNTEQDNGFIIVSNDDRTESILGYADSGSFDPDNMPENMMVWLQGYADEIKHLPATTGTRAKTKQKVSKQALLPLLTTEWNQGDPYNIKVPNFFTYGKSVTGCVATAMAQAIYHVWKTSEFPTVTTTVIPAYVCTKNWNVGGVAQQIHVPAVPITTFDWTNMLSVYSGSETTEEKNAVADLMLCCGASVKMEYANSQNGGSTSYVSRIPDAFRTYFGFDNSVRHLARVLYSTSEWEDIIYTELSNNRPVIYGGQSSNGGHAFVCDGYDGNGYFHINWGWGGNHDGYFLLSAMNPYGGGIGSSSSYDGYTMDQDIIIGIQAPGSGAADEEVRMAVNYFTYAGNNMTVARTGTTISFPFSLKCTNNLSSTYDVTMKMGIFDTADRLVMGFSSPLHFVNADGTVDWGKWAAGSWMSLNGTRTFADKLPVGNYQVKLLSQQTGSDVWYECFEANLRYVKLTVTNTQITFENVAPTEDNLEVTDIQLSTSGFVNTVQTLTAIVKNKATSYYRSNVYLFVDGEKVSGNGLSVEAGQETTAYFSFMSTTTGKKEVTIATDVDGTKVIGSDSIVINEVPGEITFNNKVYLDVDASSITNVNLSTLTIDSENNVNVEAYSQSTDIRISLVNNTSESVSGVRIVVAKYNEATRKYEVPRSYLYYGDYMLNANTKYEKTRYLNMASDYGKYEVRLYKNSSVSAANLLDNHFHFELVEGQVKVPSLPTDTRKSDIYTIDGRHVSSLPKKGLYIVNGKKILK